MANSIYNRIARSGMTKLSAVRGARRFVLNNLIRQPLQINNSFYMYMEAHQSLNLAINKTYEPDETRTLAGVLKDGMVGLNIGANIGYYTLMLAMKCRKVYAIEPNKVVYDVLKRNIVVNRKQHVVEAKNRVGGGKRKD